MRRAQTKSSFDGMIAEIPDISVDIFQDTGCTAYFLSHCHTDHTSGLYSEALLDHLKREERVFIYMSEPSAAIVRHECGGSDLVEFIKPLPIGTTTITTPRNVFTETEDPYLTVSLLPAGHCFGSVMFLFTTLYKTVLYTGDFRVSTNSVCKYAQLHENGEIIELDALYVDTTFLTERHLEFPKRSESVGPALAAAAAWLRRGARVALHTSARYGYEYVFNKMYEQLGEKVYVGGGVWDLYSLAVVYVATTFLTERHLEFPKRSASVGPALAAAAAWLRRGARVALHTSARYGYEYVFNKMYEQLGEKVYVGGGVWDLYRYVADSQFPNTVPGVTNDAASTRIHLCRNRTETKSHEGCLPNPSTDTPYLYIHFSAMKWAGYELEDPMVEVKKDPKNQRIDVCFATHCSRSELEYFVSYLSPKKVVGFPNAYPWNEGREGNKGREGSIGRDGSKGREGRVSESMDVAKEEVTDKLLSEDLMKEIFGD